MKWVKRILIAAVVVFALFYVSPAPRMPRPPCEGAVAAVWSGVEAVGRFFTSLAT